MSTSVPPVRRTLGSVLLALGLVAVLLIGAALAAGPPASVSPYAGRRPARDPIREGEIHEMEVTYMGIPGLRVTFEVLPFTSVTGRKAYHVRGNAEASSIVNLFFHLHDQVESWIDFEGLYSRRLELKQDQSDLSRVSSEVFDPTAQKTTFTDHQQKSGEKVSDTKKIASAPPLSQDTFSAFYYLRTLPLVIGASYIVPVISEGDTTIVRATVTGTENIDVRFNLIPSLIIRLEKIEPSGNPVPGGENIVWLSNDEQRILTRVDVKTRFGHVIAHLRKFTPGHL